MNGAELSEITSGRRRGGFEPQGANRYKVAFDPVKFRLASCADKVFEDPVCGIHVGV